MQVTGPNSSTKTTNVRARGLVALAELPKMAKNGLSAPELHMPQSKNGSNGSCWVVGRWWVGGTQVRSEQSRASAATATFPHDSSSQGAILCQKKSSVRMVDRLAKVDLE